MKYITLIHENGSTFHYVAEIPAIPNLKKEIRKLYPNSLIVVTNTRPNYD